MVFERTHSPAARISLKRIKLQPRLLAAVFVLSFALDFKGPEGGSPIKYRVLPGHAGLGTVMLLFGGPIMGLAFGHFYRGAALALAILSLGQIVNVWTGSCQQVLMMAGQQDTMMAITLVTGILMVAATILGVQRFGVPGISLAVAAGVALQNVLMMLAVKMRTGIWTHTINPLSRVQ